MPEIAGPEWNFSGILRRFRRIRNSEDRFYPSPPPSSLPFRFHLSFCLSRSGFRSDSIKRLFVAAKRRVKRFVRALLSILSLSLPPSPSFSLSLSFAFTVSFCIFRFLCSSLLPAAIAEIYKRERVFQGRASGSFSNGNNLEDKDASRRESRV